MKQPDTNRPSSRRLAALIVLAALLAAVMVVDRGDRTGDGSIVTPRRDTAAAPPSDRTDDPAAIRDTGADSRPEVPPIALEELTEAVARPLFSPTRRPAIGESVEGTGGSIGAMDADYALVGVVLGTDRHVALIRDMTGGTTLRVRTGDVFGGWTVDAVADGAVTIRRGSESRTLTVFAPLEGAP